MEFDQAQACQQSRNSPKSKTTINFKQLLFQPATGQNIYDQPHPGSLESNRKNKTKVPSKRSIRGSYNNSQLRKTYNATKFLSQNSNEPIQIPSGLAERLSLDRMELEDYKN